MSIRQNLWLLSFASPFFAILLASDTQAASPAVEKRLAELKQAYEAAIERQAGTAANAAIKALDAKYTAALDRFIISSTQAGKLEEAIALRDEKKRVSDGLPLPADDSDATEAVKPLRGTYRSQLAEIEAAREKQISPLKERYLQELTKLQTDTTKIGNLEDALAVKTVIDGMGNTASPSQAPDESPGKPVIVKGNGKTEPDAAKQMIEWALANKTTVKTNLGNLGDGESIKSLPKGRISLLAIDMKAPTENFPWHLLEGLSEINELGIYTVNPPTADQISHLRYLGALQRLSCESPLNVQAAEALPLNIGVKEFKTRRLETDSSNVEALEVIFRRLPNLTMVSIMDLTDSNVESACKSLATLKLLDYVRIQAPLKVSAAKQLSAAQNLRGLMLYTGAELETGSLQALPKLKHLSINGRVSLPSMLSEIAALPALEELAIDLTARPDDEISSITKLVNLNKLEVSAVAGNVNALASNLQGLKKLTHLGILESQLNDAGCASLAAMKELTTLDLSRTSITDSGLVYLAKLKQLTELKIRDNQVTDAGVRTLQKSLPRCKIYQ